MIKGRELNQKKTLTDVLSELEAYESEDDVYRVIDEAGLIPAIKYTNPIENFDD